MRSSKRVPLLFGEAKVGVEMRLLHAPTCDLAARSAIALAGSNADGPVQMELALAGLRGDNSMNPQTLEFLLRIGERIPSLTWRQLIVALLEMKVLAHNKDAVLPISLAAT